MDRRRSRDTSHRPIATTPGKKYGNEAEVPADHEVLDVVREPVPKSVSTFSASESFVRHRRAAAVPGVHAGRVERESADPRAASQNVLRSPP